MKAAAPSFLRRTEVGFTMIEMIGVLAIIAILATVLVPNGLRALDRAAITAEAQTLHNLGEQVKIHLKTYGVPPAAATWTQDLGRMADLSPADILTNKRQMARSYVYEPVVGPAVPKRVLILSSMRTGLTLPVAANLTTTALFDHVWNTADRTIPAVGANSWAGWAAWRATGGGGDFLVVERINLAPVYNTDLQNLTVTLNNKTPSAATATAPAVAATNASYVIVLANGTVQARQPLLAAASVILTPLHPRDRIDLYPVSVGGSPNSSYVLSTNSRTFDFNGTNWIPQ